MCIESECFISGEAAASRGWTYDHGDTEEDDGRQYEINNHPGWDLDLFILVSLIASACEVCCDLVHFVSVCVT